MDFRITNSLYFLLNFEVFLIFLGVACDHQIFWQKAQLFLSFLYFVFSSHNQDFFDVTGATRLEDVGLENEEDQVVGLVEEVSAAEVEAGEWERK